MTFICPICEKEPSSHSLQKLATKDNVNYFYTCPAKAKKYNDTNGILYHYRGVLEEHKNDPWVWIFDSKDFSAKHALNIDLAIKLAKLIDEYSKNLKKIEIVNPTWHIKGTLKLVLPFLEKKTQNLIRINE